MKYLGLKQVIISFLAVTGVLLLDFQDVFAQVPGVGGPNSGFSNPLGGDTTSVTSLLVNVIQWILGISAFLAMLSLIVGGVRLIIAFGNERGVQAAKQNIQWAIIGIVVILLSFAIITMVSNLVGAN